MSGGSENWFDRLTAPQTRRQSLKAAAAGTAAAVTASLPFAGSLPKAQAANASDCRKGCVFTANQSFASRQRAVAGGFLTEGLLNNVGGLGGVFGPVLGPLVEIWFGAQHIRLNDESIQLHRQEVATCFQPFCPGFNPKAPGGPCDGCEPPLFCNPCDMVESGYICCIYEPGDCHGDCCHPSPGCS